ncbi:hypothetical protein J5N97_010479 [Dioscorea zingiberensis]|uniref:Uncharacterized protein n=1 Tax=Dioscorea zingiberensis TaxID=325984 RepID=A0A9D5D0A1_9LILI|nr:hypothetical protein J5N97_010479 [Dioscorea zingiberensis]
MLVSMVHELYRSGLSEITFDKLAATVSSLCSSNREAIPVWDTLLKVSRNRSLIRLLGNTNEQQQMLDQVCLLERSFVLFLFERDWIENLRMLANAERPEFLLKWFKRLHQIIHAGFFTT